MWGHCCYCGAVYYSRGLLQGQGRYRGFVLLKGLWCYYRVTGVIVGSAALQGLGFIAGFQALKWLCVIVGSQALQGLCVIVGSLVLL